MADVDLARAYAQAILDQAVERWRHALMTFGENLEQAHGAADLDNPAEPFERKKDRLNRFLPPNAEGEVRNFAYLLASKNQVHLLPEVLAQFERLLRRTVPGEAARITSAVELAPGERAQLEQKLRGQFGSELDFEYHVDKSLLGGVVVRVGDKVIDGSVAGKLAAMRQKLEATR